MNDQKMPIPQTKTFYFWIGFKKYGDQVMNLWLKERVKAGESPAPFGPKVTTNMLGITCYVFCYTSWIPKPKEVKLEVAPSSAV